MIEAKNVASFQRFRKLPDGKGQVFDYTQINADIVDQQGNVGRVKFKYRYVTIDAQAKVHELVAEVLKMKKPPEGVFDVNFDLDE